MNISIQLILQGIQVFVFLLLLLPTLYIFIFAVAGLFYRQRPYPSTQRFQKIAVFIPGYKEDDVIIEVAKDALKQRYPSERYDIIIIADSFRKETIKQLEKLQIKIIEVSFEKSTKSKALNKAMEQLTDQYDLAVILDADNLMAEDFLEKINACFVYNCIAIQGHRTAKNMNNHLAILDAVSEEINNHIFRKGHRVLGLSSAIIGSGMAFQYNFFKSMMQSVTAIGGFDKEIELKMLKDNHKILYLDDAIVYDEKVQKAEIFSNQRRRWLSAQFHYFRRDFIASLKALIKHGNIDYFDKAIQFIQPPRILLLGAVLFFGAIFIIFNVMINSDSIFLDLWIMTMLGCMLAFLFAIPRRFYNKRTLMALVSLPKGMFLMFSSLLKIKGANKQFIHTQHTSTVNKKER